MSAPWEKTRYPVSFAGVGFSSVEVVDCDALPPLILPSNATCWSCMNAQEREISWQDFEPEACARCGKATGWRLGTDGLHVPAVTP